MHSFDHCECGNCNGCPLWLLQKENKKETKHGVANLMNSQNMHDTSLLLTWRINSCRGLWKEE